MWYYLLGMTGLLIVRRHDVPLVAGSGVVWHGRRMGTARTHLH